MIRTLQKRSPLKFSLLTKKNGGQASALNVGIAAARGEFVALLDSDDCFLPSKLEAVVASFVAHPEAGMVIHPLVKVDANGRRLGLVPQFGKLDEGMLRDQILQSAGMWAFVPTSGIVIRRDLLRRVLPIPEKQFKGDADAYLFTHVPLFGEVKAIQQPLAVYRLHSNNFRATTSRVDINWCERSLAGAERTFRVLKATAAREGLTVRDLSLNPHYAEVSGIKTCLCGAPIHQRFDSARRIWRALLDYRGADRRKRIVKGLAVSIAVLLPPSLASPLLNNVYLSSSLKRRARQIIDRLDIAKSWVKRDL